MTSKQAIQVMKEVPNPSADIILSIFAGRIAAQVGIQNNLKETISVKADNQNYKTLGLAQEKFIIYMKLISLVQFNYYYTSNFEQINLNNKDLDQYSIETVQMFYNDAKNNLEI